MNQSCKPMNTLDYWRPHKLEERGIQQVSEARNLLETCGAALTPSKSVVAEDLLARAEELGLYLKRKHLFARFKLARQYHREAGEVLRKIEGMLDQTLSRVSTDQLDS